MPSSSLVHRTLAKKKRSGPTHREVMEKRHAKRRKNEKKNLMTKKMKTLEEYQRLSKIQYESKKTTAMKIMELVEDVKERIPDGIYLQMMDQLMALNKETESQDETNSRVNEGGYYNDININSYFIDRVGNRENIIRENNRNNYEYQHIGDNWIRNEDGTWRERIPTDRRLQTMLDIYSYINR